MPPDDARWYWMQQLAQLAAGHCHCWLPSACRLILLSAILCCWSLFTADLWTSLGLTDLSVYCSLFWDDGLAHAWINVHGLWSPHYPINKSQAAFQDCQSQSLLGHWRGPPRPTQEDVKNAAYLAAARLWLDQVTTGLQDSYSCRAEVQWVCRMTSCLTDSCHSLGKNDRAETRASWFRDIWNINNFPIFLLPWS